MSHFLAFLYATITWLVQLAEIDRYVDHPAAGPALVGFTAGSLYKCTRGPRAALLAGKGHHNHSNYIN